MQVKSFVLTMGAGVAIGALGAMMLPKSSPVYHAAKDAANTIKSEAEKAMQSMANRAGRSGHRFCDRSVCILEGGMIR